MATNVTANSQDAALKAQGFADLLLISLSSTIPGAKAQGDREVSADLTPDLQDGARYGSNNAGLSSEQMERFQATGIETSHPSRKSTKRPDDPSSSDEIAGFAFALRDPNAAPNLAARGFVDDSNVSNYGRESDNLSIPESDSRPPSAEPVQALAGSAEADHSLDTIFIPIERSVVSPSSSVARVSAITLSSEQQPSLAVDAESDRGPIQPGIPSAVPADQSVSAPPTPMDAMTPRTKSAGSAEAHGLLAQPQRHDSSLLPRLASPVLRMQHTTLDGADVTQSRSANSNVGLVAERASQVSVVSKDDSKGSSTPTSTGPSIHKLSPAETDTASLAPRISYSSLGGQSSVNLQPIQSSDAASSLAIKAIHVESWATTESTNTPSPNAVPPSDAMAASLAQPFDTSEAEDPNPTPEPTSSLSPDSVSFSDTKGVSLAPLFDGTETEDPDPKTESTSSPSENIVSSGDAKRVSFAQPVETAGTEDASPTVEDAFLMADDSPQKEIGKHSANHASTAASDRKTGSPTISLSDAPNAESPKVDPQQATRAARAAGADVSPVAAETAVPSNGNVLMNLADPVMKSGDQSERSGSSNAHQEQTVAVMQSAHLVAEVGKSDVKIALQGEQFGSVELHAKVTGDQVSASITVDHHETHALLSGDLPALHQILNERQLRVNEIILLHDSLLSGGSADDGPFPRRDGASPQQTGSPSSNRSEGLSSLANDSNGQTSATAIFDSRGRLSVRA